MVSGGFNFTAPLELQDEWADYFREYGSQREAYFHPVVEEDEEPVEAVVLLETARPISSEFLGSAPRKVFEAATALGWRVALGRSMTSVAPVLYAGGSEEGAAKQYQAGDVRFAGYIARHYWMAARHPEMRLGFQAHWMGKGVGGTTAPFEDARVFDPVGIPVENWVDYTKDVRTAKEANWSDSRRKREGQIANDRINDGSDRLEHEHQVASGTEFLVWLDDWLGMAGLPKIAPAPRKTKEEKAAERELGLLNGEEWHG